jgi:restriction endonuclease S subunit
MKDFIENTTDTLQIDKQNWTKVKFGAVAIQQKTSVDRDKTDLTFYVKGEHMGSQDLHLREWGKLTDEYLGPAFIRYFEKDDILYGSRRTYLRKVVIAPFEGITSNTTLVIKANEKIIDKRLLPFVMMSEGFTDHSIKNSKGSVNPYINWKDLANYEFLLPPKAEQARLAELLWAIDEVIENEKKVLLKLEINLNSFIKQTFTSHIKITQKELKKVKSLYQTTWKDRLFPENWTIKLLKDVISDSQNGFAEGQRDDKGIPQLRMNNVSRDGRIDLQTVAMIPLRNNLDRYKIIKGDVIFCNTNSEDLVGKSIIATEEIESFSFSNHFTRLRANKSFLTQKFLYLWLKFHFDIGLFERLCTRWIGQAAVQTQSLMKLQIILPPVEEQLLASNYCQDIENQIDLVKAKISASQSLQKSLINLIF